MIKGTGYTHRKWYIYILMRYRMVRWFCLSVILSVRYRNHFPVVQFQNQAHIRNPHETGQVFKTIWGPGGTRYLGRRRRPKFFYFLSSFTAAVGGVFPNGAEGGCFAFIWRILSNHLFLTSTISNDDRWLKSSVRERELPKGMITVLYHANYGSGIILFQINYYYKYFSLSHSLKL